MSSSTDRTAGKGRVVIVTGAAGGIGSATVARLLGQGFTVAAVDIDAAGLEALRNRLDHPPRLETYDFNALTDAEPGISRIAGTLGIPYGLVNNAALIHAGTAATTTDEDWAQSIDNNLTAPFRMVRAVLPHMRARGAGVIVNIGSIGAGIGFKDRVAYVAAKAGLVGMTRAMAVDHGPEGIRINAVNPGTTETPLLRGIFADTPDPEATRRRSEAHQLIGRIGQPDEIAAAIAFLIGDDASYLHGSTITVDGGRSIW